MPDPDTPQPVTNSADDTAALNSAEPDRSGPLGVGPRVSRTGAYALVFFTSAAVLVLEIIAGRLMAPYVGVSLETFTGVIGTILAGIAVGSAIGGRLADAVPPERVIGPTLVLGGVLAAVSVPIVATIGPSMGTDPLSIVTLAAFSFLAPTTVLSAISPMVAKVRLGDLGDTGRVVGSLSAAGTFGALAGTFVTGFVLVAALPSRPTVLAVAAALILAGIVLSRRWGRQYATSGARTDRASAVGAALAVGLLGLSSLAPEYCDVESAYSCIRVVPDPDRPSGRSLYLANLRNSYVDLDDPTYLDFRYFRLAADVAAGLPDGPLDALHLGGAGFTFPRYIETLRPGSDQLVLEIDEALVDVARDELGLVTGPQLRVGIGDARTAIDDLADDSFDLVVGDVFSGLSVPWHLTTAEVMAELDRTLRPNGLFLANIIDGGKRRFLRAELATLATTFDHVAVVVPPQGDTTAIANYVVIGSDRPLPRFDIDPVDGLLWEGRAVDDLVDGADALTDDFAPADQLTRNF